MAGKAENSKLKACDTTNHEHAPRDEVKTEDDSLTVSVQCMSCVTDMLKIKGRSWSVNIAMLDEHHIYVATT